MRSPPKPGEKRNLSSALTRRDAGAEVHRGQRQEARFQGCLANSRETDHFVSPNQKE